MGQASLFFLMMNKKKEHQLNTITYLSKTLMPNLDYEAHDSKISLVQDLLLFLILNLLFACSDGTQMSSADATAAREATEPTRVIEVKREEQKLPPLKKTIHLSCGEQDLNDPISIQGNQDTELTLSGEVCPELLSEDPLILFIVDVSGSMADRQNTGILGIPTGPLIPGADNYENGSCGRYDAIKAILAKARNGGATQNGRAALILFSSEIHQNSLGFFDIAEFEAFLNPEDICIADDGTNYQQAFLEAKELMDSEQGELKLAYFISDGQPTVINGGFNPSQDEVNQTSIASGKSLINSDVSLFQVFLGEAEPEDIFVMEEIAGSKESIREVNDASELAPVLADFSAVNLSKNNLSIRVNNEDLAINVFEEIKSSSNNRWAWETNSLLIPENSNYIEVSLSLTHKHIETISFSLDLEIQRD